jgi:hypothetical protein
MRATAPAPCLPGSSLRRLRTRSDACETRVSPSLGPHPGSGSPRTPGVRARSRPRRPRSSPCAIGRRGAVPQARHAQADRPPALDSRRVENVENKEGPGSLPNRGPGLSVSMTLGDPVLGLFPVRHCTRRSPTRTSPPPNPNYYCPMDHLLFGAAIRGGTQPSRSREPPEPSGTARVFYRASQLATNSAGSVGACQPKRERTLAGRRRRTGGAQEAGRGSAGGTRESRASNSAMSSAAK